jgi:hypothetical protein
MKAYIFGFLAAVLVTGITIEIGSYFAFSGAKFLAGWWACLAFSKVRDVFDA